MFFRVNNHLIDLDDIAHAEVHPSPELHEPHLSIEMKHGDYVVIPGSVMNPELLLDLMVAALDSVGLMYNPEDEILPEDEVPLDEDEAAELKQALDQGYEWLARDKDGKVWAFRHKPEKHGAYWEDPDSSSALKLHRDWYWEITPDKQPMSIIRLLIAG